VQLGVIGVVVAMVIGTLAVFLGRDGGSSSASDSTSSRASTPSTVAALPSVAGKPCVAVTGPLPPGAPTVPVRVGPPPTTLVTQDLKPGTGAPVQASSTVTVDYIGVACSTGKVFDSSYQRGQTATFPLAQVIPGWEQGLTGMQAGGERLLGIPPNLAYGTQGAPDAGIAPGETLWFVVTVRNVQPGAGG